MQRSSLPIVCLAAALVAGACENGPPWGDRQERAAQAPGDFGPTAAYERRLVFLGPGQRLPTAAVMDFITLSDSVGVRRGARVRLADGIDWLPLLDASWELEPMRAPWRLTPHGPLSLIVGDAGELSAVVLRLDPEVRLEPGPTLAEHSPDAGTQLVLRQGRLALERETVRGILLDAQLGRPMDAAEVARGRTRVSGDGPHPTPAAVAGTEAMLLDNTGYYAVFATSSAGRIAWFHHGGRDDVARGAYLEPIRWDTGEGEGGVEVPTGWRVVHAGDLAGELNAETAEGVALQAAGDLQSLGYAVVTGWIQDRGVRRDVYGLVRHVR